jgi:DNA/RNA-binding domain of Phe-tRNA-synthetase-like protein
VDNAVACPELDRRKRAVETSLRARFKGVARAEFGAIEVLRDYQRYYKSFDKTYHVQLQLESIVSKGKSLPDVSPLVDANFVAELETLVLTAGHDAAKLREPLCIDLSREGDVIVQMNGTSKPIRVGDMVMRDADAVSCSILYGQDNRSPISRQTAHVLYVAYAPPGVSAAAVEAQLAGILANVRTFAPGCSVVQQTLLRAG